MKTRRSVMLSLALAAFVACSDGDGTGSAQRQSNASALLEPQMSFSDGRRCTTVRLTETGLFDDNTGNINDVGLITIGDAPPRRFTSVVTTLSADFDRMIAGKQFKAVQREEITFENGDQLYMQGPTVSVPMSAPALWEATQTAKFDGGTGEFAGAHGNIFVKGLTMYDPGTAETWVGWYIGELCL